MNWQVKSDVDLLEHLGKYIQQHRLQSNRTQKEVAEKAGISRSTLSLLEGGEPTSTNTLVRVMRVLDLLHLWDQLIIPDDIRPLDYAKSKKNVRKRARPGMSEGESDNDFTW